MAFKARSLLNKRLVLATASVILGVVFGYRFIAFQNYARDTATRAQLEKLSEREEFEAHFPQRGTPGQLRRSTRGDETSMAQKGVVDGIPDRPRNADDIHLVFSTDCSPYQDWQAFLLFHSARASGNLGRITRIASGCSDAEMQRLREIHMKLPPEHDLHFTPDYTIHAADEEVYPFNNKPNGFVHFLANAEPPITATIIAVLDPDMIVLRKISPLLGPEEVYRPGHPNVQVRGRDAKWVTRGHPVAQSYGYGGEWVTWPELRAVVPPESPVFALDSKEANKFYAAGPPYLMHVTDWQHMSKGWARYTPMVLKEHPGLLAEMQAWSLGAVEAKLPHTVVHSWMASDLESGADEEWQVLDQLPPEHACITPEDFRALHGSKGPDGKPRPIPAVLHYCQLYRQGLYMFAKRHPDLQDIFRCGGPLLMEPPPHVTTMHTMVHPHGASTRIEELDNKNAQRQTAALCLATKALNVALQDFRERSCPAEANTTPFILHLTDLRDGDLADNGRWKELNVL